MIRANDFKLDPNLQEEFYKAYAIEKSINLDNIIAISYEIYNLRVFGFPTVIIDKDFNSSKETRKRS